VPKVTGKTLAVGEQAIRADHCSVGKITRVYSAKVKKGRVVSESPKAGTSLARNAKVNLTVSRGKRPHNKR
jgi:beta-lactam-binding protein with PASTA domain